MMRVLFGMATQFLNAILIMNLFLAHVEVLVLGNGFATNLLAHTVMQKLLVAQLASKLDHLEKSSLMNHWIAITV